MPSMADIARPRPLHAMIAWAPGPISYNAGNLSAVTDASPNHTCSSCGCGIESQLARDSRDDAPAKTLTGPGRQHGHGAGDETPLSIEAIGEQVELSVRKALTLPYQMRALLGIERPGCDLAYMQRHDARLEIGEQLRRASIRADQHFVAADRAACGVDSPLALRYVAPTVRERR